ncbi:AraC family transcriptional regulator [Methylobrevis pamukkalensis]|uniref:Transcriptional activator NphR n=1 Tax=Methylobrevis pamukkalensis TaxID=1439726 RepID=A0A1E3H5P2_9HYPH|nr:AraC family transcriptional regulator [Methylobrevis pamukkalensis]ODN71649.1 Transcriptional activator NphR [Methylobrevis pamukkalensis]
MREGAAEWRSDTSESSRGPGDAPAPPQSLLAGDLHLTLPPDRQDRLSTDDMDRIHAEMSRAISHHVARPEPGTRRISASKAEASLGNLGLIQISYGARMSIRAETCGPNFLVQVPLSGQASIRNGRETVDSHPGMATIIRPDVPLDFRFSADFDLLVLRLPADRLERQCEQLLDERGGGLDRRLAFSLAFPLASEGGLRWLRLLKYLRDEAVSGTSLLFRSPLAMASCEQMLMNALISLQPNNYSEALFGRPVTTVSPFYVRRAEDYMRAHAAEPLMIGDIAGAAGISVRALHRGFQEFRGTSPLAMLKSIRLQHVREDLLTAEPGRVSVTAVALKWGFGHLGHFGQDYRQRFGETPMETLRRAGSQP